MENNIGIDGKSLDDTERLNPEIWDDETELSNPAVEATNAALAATAVLSPRERFERAAARRFGSVEKFEEARKRALACHCELAEENDKIDKEVNGSQEDEIKHFLVVTRNGSILSTFELTVPPAPSVLRYASNRIKAVWNTVVGGISRWFAGLVRE